jgi:hypothetical protein
MTVVEAFATPEGSFLSVVLPDGIVAKEDGTTAEATIHDAFQQVMLYALVYKGLFDFVWRVDAHPDMAACRNPLQWFKGAGAGELTILGRYCRATAQVVPIDMSRIQLGTPAASPGNAGRPFYDMYALLLALAMALLIPSERRFVWRRCKRMVGFLLRKGSSKANKVQSAARRAAQHASQQAHSSSGSGSRRGATSPPSNTSSTQQTRQRTTASTYSNRARSDDSDVDSYCSEESFDSTQPNVVVVDMWSAEFWQQVWRCLCLAPAPLVAVGREVWSCCQWMLR